MHGGHQGRERIFRNFGPPTDDEPFRYEFTAPLGTYIIRGTLVWSKAGTMED